MKQKCNAGMIITYLRRSIIYISF